MGAKRPLTDTEVQDLITNGFTGAEKIRNRALFCFGVATGYRVQELLHHRIGDVVQRRKVSEYVEIPKRFRKGKTSGQTKRLMPFARIALQSHVDNEFIKGKEEGLYDKYGDMFNEYLFKSNKVDPRTGRARPISVSWAWTILDDAFYRCNIEGAVGTHSMRKTFAAKIYKKANEDFRAGLTDIEPIRILQLHLGHTNINSTIKYLSFITLHIDESQFQFSLTNDK